MVRQSSSIIQNLVVHYVKSVRIRSYSGPYFSTFALNTERYGKMRENTDQNNSEYGQFLHSGKLSFSGFLPSAVP